MPKSSGDLRSPSSTPILDILHAGETVSTVLFNLHAEPGGFVFYFSVVPASRIGRSLPDWPRALSLKPDLNARQN